MKKSILKISGILILIIGLYNIKSYAAISASSKTVESGSKVSISISSNVAILSYKVTMTDAGGLTFSGSSGGTGAGTKTITDAKSTGMRSLATYTFTVPTVSTDTKYNVKFYATAMEDENFNAVADDSAVAVITVKGTGNNANSGNTDNNNSGNNGGSTTSKSSNANLKNLGITPNDFKGFSASKTTYNVTVPYDVEAVTVYASVQDSKATITSGTGKKKLKEGTTPLDVVVKAEDGTTKTYKINVTRNSEDGEMVPNVVEEPEEKEEKLRLTAISLQNDLNLTLTPAFNSETFEYTVEVENNIEKIELSGIPNVNNAKVEITGNDKLIEGENIVTITVKADGYEDVIYKIKVIRKSLTEEVQEENKEPIGTIDLDNSMVRTKLIIVISLVVFIIIAIVVILVLKRKKNKRLYSSYYDYYNDNSGDDKRVDVLKEMQNDNTEESTSKDNNVNEEDNDIEIPEGYTAEIEEDQEYYDKAKRKRGKGKHF